MKETVHLRSFEAVSESGDQLTVHVYQDVVIVQTRGGTERIPGMMSMQLDGGEHVNLVSKGVYETPFGVKLTSDDPNAP